MISNMVRGPSEKHTFEVLNLLDLLVQMVPCPDLQLLILSDQLLVIRTQLPMLEEKLLVQPSSGGMAMLQK